MVFDPNNGYLYIGEGVNGNLTVLDTRTNTVIAELQVGTNPQYPIFAKTPVYGEYPIYPFLDPANGLLYVSNPVSNQTSVISGDTIITTITVGHNPTTPFLNPKNDDVYVPNYLSNYLSVISGTTYSVVANVTLAEGIGGETFDPNNGDIYLTGTVPCSHACPQDLPGHVLILSAQTNSLIGNITLDFGNLRGCYGEGNPGICPDSPSPPVFDPVNGDIYVSNGGGNTTSVISGTNNTLLANIVVGQGPGAPAFDPINGNLYVPCGYVSGWISVVSSATNHVVATIKVETIPNDAFFNPANGDIYVPESMASDISIISGATNTVIARLGVGGDPYALALNPANGEVYVGCGSESVWAISYSTTP
jgi:YVTN family beta-propeller protein